MVNFLFIQSLIDHDIDRALLKIYIALCFWALDGIAVIIDLFFGVKRAKRMGIARTSELYRLTIKKSNQYGAFLTFAFLFDVILSLWFYMPFATAVCSAFIIFIEARSVWESLEKNDQKNYKTNAVDFMGLIRRIRQEEKLLEEIEKKIKESDKTEENGEDSDSH